MATAINPYRNAFADEPHQNTQKYCDLPKPNESPEAKVLTASSKWLCISQKGAGGGVIIRPLADEGLGRKQSPKVNCHAGRITDLAFSPFNPNMLLTGSEDTSIIAINLEADPETKQLKGPLSKDDIIFQLSDHAKKVSYIAPHPTANNVLASTGWDRTVKVWDLVKTQEAISIEAHGHNTPFSLEWNRNGSLLATTCKDKMLRVFDPRAKGEAVQEAQFSESSKCCKMFWIPSKNWVGVYGFTKKAKRQCKIWDLAAGLSAPPILKNTLDNTSSIFFPTYDDETGLLWLWSKGDGSMSFSEIVDDGGIKIKPLVVHRSATPTKGGCFIPKVALNTAECELARFMKLTTNPEEVVPLRFTVPRKAGFSADLFPDCPGAKAAQKAEAYLSGNNADPILTPMDPETLQAELGIEVEKVLTYAELKDENEALKARIAELEAQLGGEN